MKALILIPLFFLLVQLSCTALVDFDEKGTPEDCQNGKDDDGDGYVDCNDQDCWETLACFEQFEICDNFIDDNGDGLVDCEDYLCASDPACTEEFDLCNEMLGNEAEIWMYLNVYQSSAYACAEPWMQCRIDYRTDGVPRCVYPEEVGVFGNTCYNDLECPMGHVCTRSQAPSTGMEPWDLVCLPLCSNVISTGCPPDMECFNRLEPIYDGTLPGALRVVEVFTCDTPGCQVLGENFNSRCPGELETCYPHEDMMGNGQCARVGTKGQGLECTSDSDCLPRHVCRTTGEGDRPRCARVCKTPTDCTIDGSEWFECRLEPYWATYGICVGSNLNNF